jgi:hypothetical protein
MNALKSKGRPQNEGFEGEVERAGGVKGIGSCKGSCQLSSDVGEVLGADEV